MECTRELSYTKKAWLTKTAVPRCTCTVNCLPPLAGVACPFPGKSKEEHKMRTTESLFILIYHKMMTIKWVKVQINNNKQLIIYGGGIMETCLYSW